MHTLRMDLGLTIVLVLLTGGLAVSALLAWLMLRGGSSPRPAFWFAGFFALVVLPQVAGHLWKARLAAAHAPSIVAEVPQGDPSFGPDVDPAGLSDLRRVPDGPFAAAEQARFAVLPHNETVILARFASEAQAEHAWQAYLRAAGFDALDADGDSERGVAAERVSGDRAYALQRGRWVGVWTAPDDMAIRRRMAIGGVAVPEGAPLDGGTGAGRGSDGPSPMPSTALGRTLLAGGGAAYLLVVVMFFFKGAAWAGSVRAAPGTTPVAAAELAARLKAINTLDVPMRLERGDTPDEWIATWRYADATWMDLARVRKLKRGIRVRLRLDAASGTVRVTDQISAFDASAGAGGAELAWQSSIGIVFFQRERQRVFGLQFDPQGRFVPVPSYAWRFDADEMKAPLIEAVTRAGWQWRPTVWQGPAWLRWLTG